MYLKGISLKNFRNIQKLSLALHPRFNIFVGPNAQGKTNILESIYLLAFGRSFRILDYKTLIRWGEKEATVRGWIQNPLGEEERIAHLGLERKKIFKNGKAASPNQFQSMPTVLFAPEEILLLKESPQARRDYIDGLLSKLSPTYGDQLHNYKRTLSQRNKLLKNEFLSEEEKRNQMILWEQPLLEHGRFLIGERSRWIERLSEVLIPQYKTIAGDGKMAMFFYKPNVTADDFLKQQEAKRSEEIERGLSLVGPHRDDFIASLDSKPIQSFGSQGEMRSFTLALKLTEIRLFEEVIGESPLLLLDDVLSELDEKRKQAFLAYLQNYKAQVFTTATSLNLFPMASLGEFSSWEISKGESKLI